MRGRRDTLARRSGYCMAEMLLVLGLLSICAVFGFAQLGGGVQGQRARGSAQCAQTAVAWAQLSVLWQGGERRLVLGGDSVVNGSAYGPGAIVECLAPSTSVSANVARWNTATGVVLSFLHPFASPDSGGSVYFGHGGRLYKVTVRPESGLTTRTWTMH